jgi:iron complex transport system permease protein
MSPQRLRLSQLLTALAALVAAVLVGCVTGAADLPLGGVAAALLDRIPFVHLDPGLSPLQENILFLIRLPRVITGVVVGGLLALAGAGYQGVFRNPLADPYLLGAAAGAGLGATGVIVWGGAGDATLPAAAFVGALTGVGLAYTLGAAAHGQDGGTGTLLLAGVAVTSFLTAIQAFVQQSRIDDIKRIYSWVLGHLSGNGWSDLVLIAPYAAVGTLLCLLHGRHLDILALGDEEAASLGIRPGRVRFAVLAAASLATASAVAISGLIGFVGVVVPHAVRRFAGTGNRVVLPLSLIAGGVFMVLADSVARTVLAPAEVPIGVITMFFGAPFFVMILRMTRTSLL